MTTAKITKKELTLRINEVLKMSQDYLDRIIRENKLATKYQSNAKFFSRYSEAYLEPMRRNIDKGLLTPEEAVMMLLGNAAFIQQQYIDKPRLDTTIDG
jgi:hypothetical protein